MYWRENMNKDYSREIPKDWQLMSKVYECLGDEQRQRILLSFEKDEELSAKDIVEVSTIKRTTVVFHLKKMEEAGILSSRKDGKSFYYKINKEVIRNTLNTTLDYINNNI